MHNSYYHEGIYDMTAEQYHADPCPEPSLSASIATIITQHSPRHAWLAHKRNPDYVERTSATFDFGRAMHAAVLEPEKELIVSVDADDWRTKESKAKKDEIQASGKIPVLSKQCDKIELISAMARQFIRGTRIGRSFIAGDKEKTIIVRDVCWLRGRLDCISADRKLIIDYKTVRNANPDSFMRSSMFSFGYDIQAAMYVYLNKLSGFKGDCEYVWFLQETEAPYSCSLIGASDSILACGMRKLEFAKQQWMKCLSTNEWPGYGNDVFYLDAPSWEMAKVEMMDVNYLEV